jgi:hypothetical protein
MKRSSRVYGVQRDEPPLKTQRIRKMTKPRNIVGIAFVAMSLLTGFAHAQIALQGPGQTIAQCYDLPGYGEVCD